MATKQYRFNNYAGTYQFRVATAAELVALGDLPDAFWMATSAPTAHLRCDPVLLQFLDVDGNGRILSNDLRRASRWLLPRLADCAGVTAASDSLALAHLRTDTDEGRRLATSARRILANLGQADAETIALSAVRDHQSYRRQGIHNGDGVVPLDALGEDDLKGFVTDIMATVGSTPDLNGQPGVNQALLDKFTQCSRELLDWSARAAADHADRASLFPLGDATAAGHDLLAQLRGPLNLYFRLCRLQAFNQLRERPTPVRACPAEVVSAAADVDSFLAAEPPAPPTADRRLDFGSGLNPTYADRLERLRRELAVPILGSAWDDRCLTEADWQKLLAAFAPYEGWLAAKSGGEVEKLGPDKLRAYMAGDLPSRLAEIIAADLAIGQELAAARDLECVILLQRWLLALANNFVSFHHLYDPGERAMFEEGRLVLAGRVFNFTMRVDDLAKHVALAADSGMFLVYCEITGSAADTPFIVVAPVTARTSRGLTMDRRGVFFDLSGREWDARVIKMIENPVSLWEAIGRPFVRLGQLVTQSVERLSGGAEKALEGQVTKSLTTVEADVTTGVTQSMQVPAAAPPAAPPAAAPAGGSKSLMLLSGSVGIAALGSSFAFIVKTLSTIKPHMIFYGLLGALAIVLIPTILIADWKLHHRNLAALLAAGGWAVNAPMRLTRRLAKLLTPRPVAPPAFFRYHGDLTRAMLRRLKREGLPQETDQQ